MAFEGTISGGNTLVFAGWQQVLAASDLATGLKTAHGREVARFLVYCEQVHMAPTVESARQATQIYRRVRVPPSPRLRRAGKPGLGVRSPLDRE